MICSDIMLNTCGWLWWNAFCGPKGTRWLLWQQRCFYKKCQPQIISSQLKSQRIREFPMVTLHWIKPNVLICMIRLLFTQKSQLQNFRNFESPWHHVSSLKMDHTRNIDSTEISKHLTPRLSSCSLMDHSTLIRTPLVICHCEKWLL